METMTADIGKLKVQPDNEEYWLSIRDTMKPFYVNTQLVNSRRGPAPAVVRDKIRSLVDLSLSYELDEYEPFREMKESGSSLSIRTGLAEYFGAEADEIALTRNAMEGIATVLNGLDLKAGDEVVATNFCYDFNLAIIKQRVERDGIKLLLVDLPFGAVDAQELIEAFEKVVNPRTKLVSIPHVVGRTGLVLPVKGISSLARKFDCFVLVDGAHSTGHLDFVLRDLECDAFATCLHKWMYGPRGTGFLYIRKDRIREVWPLFAPWSGVKNDSIEKFEEVGTVFKAPIAAIQAMLSFNKAIGQAEKSARFAYLRDRWMSRLSRTPAIEILTDVRSSPPTSFGAFSIRGIDDDVFANHLLKDFQISVKAFTMEEHPSMSGIHLSPGLANTVEEIDRFVAATFSTIAKLRQSDETPAA